MPKSLAPEVTTWPNPQPQLIGSRCDECGATTFPQQKRCPRCGTTSMSERLLPREGTLVAWTTQGFLPKDYVGNETVETFVPFGWGLVQLGDEVRVEARLTTADPQVLEHVKDVELKMIPIAEDDDGDDILMFAFAPIDRS